jgi:hypothetical protein
MTFNPSHGEHTMRMIRVVVLNDGETYTGISGCAVLDIPEGVAEIDIDSYVKDNVQNYGVPIDPIDK